MYRDMRMVNKESVTHGKREHILSNVPKYNLEVLGQSEWEIRNVFLIYRVYLIEWARIIKSKNLIFISYPNKLIWI